MDPDEDAFDDDDSIPLPAVIHAPAARPHLDALLEEAAGVSGGEWAQRYRRAVGEAFRDGFRTLSTPLSEWELIVGTTENECILFFQQQQQGFFRISATLAGDRVERFIWVIKDFDKDTRLLWDSSVINVQQLETYRNAEGDIDVVKWEEHGRGLWKRRFYLGVQTTHYNPRQRSYSYVFKTAPHYYFGKKEQQSSLFFCVWIRALDDGQCQLELVLKGADENEQVWRERVRLWEQVVGEWDRYYPLDPKLVENRK